MEEGAEEARARRRHFCWLETTVADLCPCLPLDDSCSLLTVLLFGASPSSTFARWRQPFGDVVAFAETVQGRITTLTMRVEGYYRVSRTSLLFWRGGGRGGNRCDAAPGRL
ncbi:hypothetical protein BCR35DRAFT_302107 [Leucosporidium creatinivorum]|uniref:Uncharacterized protein n=1 Tax=Leucosporidium creatinivorum TaxID=106004 RepID=A0A1Y2FVY7_9BASI|nr:hypothetical protein BCR35DRAFT_302107 [Leucosporidium creatinivorum]